MTVSGVLRHPVFFNLACVLGAWSLPAGADGGVFQAYDTLMADAVPAATLPDAGTLLVVVAPAGPTPPGESLQLDWVSDEESTASSRTWPATPGLHRLPRPAEATLRVHRLAADGSVLARQTLRPPPRTRQLLLQPSGRDGLLLRAWSAEQAAPAGRRLLGALSFWDGEGAAPTSHPLGDAPLVNWIRQQCAANAVRASLAGIAHARALVESSAGDPIGVYRAVTPCHQALASLSPLVSWMGAAGLAIPAARLALQRGAPETALQHLSVLSAERAGQADVLDLRSRALMAQGRHAEAAKLLSRGPHLELSEAWLSDTAWNDAEQIRLDTLRVNYGIALINAGRADEGRAALDVVGRRARGRLSANAVADQANLLLGWQFLREQRGGEAAAVFERIGLDAAQANAGLLGRGWAAMAGNQPPIARLVLPGLQPGGMSRQALLSLHESGALGCHELQAVSSDFTGSCFSRPSFEQVRFSQDMAARARSALAVWEALSPHPLQWSHWAEGRMAAADVLFAAGRHEAALTVLDAVVRRLEHWRQAALAMADTLQDPALTSWSGAACDRDPAACWLAEWARDTGLHAVDQAVRVLDVLILDAGNDDAAIRRLHAVQAPLKAHLRQALRARLQQRSENLRQYARLARLKLARGHEAPRAAVGRYDLLLVTQ